MTSLDETDWQRIVRCIRNGGTLRAAVGLAPTCEPVVRRRLKREGLQVNPKPREIFAEDSDRIVGAWRATRHLLEVSAETGIDWISCRRILTYRGISPPRSQDGYPFRDWHQTIRD